jgi:BirA family transcriptional regulator, biotin operon repressor / biotin---[acetyl-CoA-carboxylase] ligase
MDALPHDLAAALEDDGGRLGPFGQLRYFADVASTNDIALALAASGAPEGTSVLAGAQHAGRGRRGHEWFSPDGAGIYLSVLLRPHAWGPISLLTIAAGVATGRAIHAATALPVELKWPNDVVIGRPWRKLAGLLCEGSGTGASLDAVVVGIGINVNLAAYPPGLAWRATSLEAELGRPVDRASIVVECLAGLAAMAADLGADRSGAILSEWRRLGRAGLDGAHVCWVEHGVERRGLARDIDLDGALLVEPAEPSTARGRAVERLIAGEVTWERLSRD